MKSRNLSARLQLLNGGRSHYLEFLRNLTPQAILFSVVVLVGRKLGFGFDINNWLPTALFFIVLGAFVLAFYANSTLFYEKCFSEWKAWVQKTDKYLSAKGVKGPRRTFEKIKLIWREQFAEFMELLVVIYFFQIALAIVIVLGTHSAISAIRATHAG